MSLCVTALPDIRPEQIVQYGSKLQPSSTAQPRNFEATPTHACAGIHTNTRPSARRLPH
ncbi:hypothetical protein D557_2423 [Bordetella holmesii 70147]|nr:hypothetical protein D557_2423 [Bordetella holmesii 70147]